MVDISIVVPVYNEESNVSPLDSSLRKAMSGKSYEVVYVDDGSTDGSYNELLKAKKEHNEIKIVKLRKNFGQSAALNAGFSNSSGSIVVSMDADLQNDPEDIPRLLEKMKEGFDVVSGWRKERRDPLGKKIASKFANKLYTKLTGLKIHDSGCSLKAYKKEALRDLELYGEMHRFIPALIAAKGFKIGEMVVNHRSRKFGKTKYSSSRLVHGFLDLLYVNFWTRYSTKPLHYFGGIGFLAILVGVVVGVYKAVSLAVKILYLGQEVFVGPLLLFAVFSILIGFMLIMFGFLAEIKIRLYYGQTKKKPYEIKEFVK
jgi:glycosyltransferase involved in cell wall biosynthesis